MLIVRKSFFLVLASFVVFVLIFGSGAAASSYSQTLHVESTYISNTPTASPSPTPTPTAASTEPPSSSNPTPTPTATTTSNPTQQPATASPTQNPDVNSESAIPEFPTAAAILIIFLLIAVAAVIYKKQVDPGHKGSRTAAFLLIVGLSCSVFAGLALTQTTAQTTSGTLHFTLYFPNGTACPTDGSNMAGYVNGGFSLNVGGIRCSASNYGSQYMPITNVLVLKNDADTPITVNATLKNLNAPSNIGVWFSFYPLAPSTYAPYSNSWIWHDGNVATQNPVAPGQHMYLGLVVTLHQTDNLPSGTPTYNFSYSFDIEVTATDA
ncbi:MAG: hypothetical protein NWE92_13775 [Candidatus Bathyarchaeota archaeon]|nr:hypothetical protein [Candidatus Bathyarchaeota archaeon]